MTRKPDDDVGSADTSTHGAEQTPQQAAITRQEAGGRTEAERNAEWSSSGGQPGRTPTSIGGSSGGHSDQKAAQGPHEGEKVAGGGYKSERGN